VSSFQRERELLGQRLREIRRDARLTGRQLAVSQGWSPSKISKIEAGRQTPSDADVEAWATVCGVPESTGDFIAALRAIESHYIEKRRKFRSGLARNQRELADFETQASIVRCFEVVVVPGLLQTAEYARHRLVGGLRFGGGPADVDDAVAARMTRQNILYRPDMKLHIVTTEAALRLQLCPADVMAGQLDRLIAASTINNVRFGVIPFDADYRRAPLNGFWIYDEEMVHAETLTAVLHLSEPTEISSYLSVFGQFAELAVYGAQARALITRVLDDLVR
jgi:transcriptional regulator with XRE-family HTH domain